MRVCLDCKQPTTKTRCPDCTRAKDKARGTRQQRGYDTSYDRLHRDYQRRMNQGETFECWRCAELGRPAHTVDPRPGHWHLGHSNTNRDVIRGPQCPATNLDTSTQARLSQI